MLVVTADPGPLPADTRLNVRYGGNPDGEPYALDAPRTPQAVSCEEDTSLGGAGPSAGAAGGEAPDAASDVWRLRCGLYTQGPARIDLTATGYEPIEDLPLSFESGRGCEVLREVKLLPAKPDAGT